MPGPTGGRAAVKVGEDADWRDMAITLVAQFEGCAQRGHDGLIRPCLDRYAKPNVWTRGYGRTYGISQTSPAITADEAEAELRVGLENYAIRCLRLAPNLAQHPPVWPRSFPGRGTAASAPSSARACAPRSTRRDGRTRPATSASRAPPAGSSCADWRAGVTPRRRCSKRESEPGRWWRTAATRARNPRDRAVSVRAPCLHGGRARRAPSMRPSSSARCQPSTAGRASST